MDAVSRHTCIPSYQLMQTQLVYYQRKKMHHLVIPDVIIPFYFYLIKRFLGCSCPIDMLGIFWKPIQVVQWALKLVAAFACASSTCGLWYVALHPRAVDLWQTVTWRPTAAVKYRHVWNGIAEFSTLSMHTLNTFAHPGDVAVQIQSFACAYMA